MWQTPTNQMSEGKGLASPAQRESGSVKWLHWVAPNSISFGQPWIYTAVDDTGTFERPVLMNGLGSRFWILYQGPGYLKLARQL